MVPRNIFACLCVFVLTSLLLILGSRHLPRPHVHLVQYESHGILHSTEVLVNEKPNTVVPSLTIINSTESDKIYQHILGDMRRCSLGMGISAETLDTNQQKLEIIANKSARFLRAFWEVVPGEYLPGIKSPCWYSNITIDKDAAKIISSNLGHYLNTIPKANIKTIYRDIFNSPTIHSSRLYCLPYFLIGGFPKSGTTTLHTALSQHPQVTSPQVKEVHWWARVPLGKMNKIYLKIVVVRYLLNFLSAADRISEDATVVTYDGSQSTMIDSNFGIDDQDYCAMAAVVHRVLPSVKIIIIMRDPVARIHSHFYYMHNANRWPIEMQVNSPLYFDKYVKAAIKDFNNCRRNYSLFECTNKKSRRKQLSTWLGVGIYHIQILEWLQFWPRENFIFLKTKQLSNEPISVLRNITHFLSIDQVPDKDALKWFSKKVNFHGRTDDMLPTTRRALEEFYAPHNKQLEELLIKLT